MICVFFVRLAGGEEEETAEVTSKMRVDLVAKMIQSLAGKKLPFLMDTGRYFRYMT